MAILIHKKLKSLPQIRLAGKHNVRELTVENADPSRETENYVAFGGRDLEAAWRRKMKQLDVAKPRSNSVLMVEQVLTASPEYFRPDNPSAYGTWDRDRAKKWEGMVKHYLYRTHRKNLVQVVFHYDEATPHCHAMIIPVVEGKARKNAKRNKDGSLVHPARNKLDARSIFFGDKRYLQKHQDEYAKYMQPLGLSRGEKGSKATHVEVKKYYQQVNSSKQATRAVSRVGRQAALTADELVRKLTEPEQQSNQNYNGENDYER